MSTEPDDTASPYCPTCGACGEPGCCPPGRCRSFVCMYGEDYVRNHERDQKQMSQLYDCLLALGVYNPFDFTVEMAEELSAIKTGWNIRGEIARRLAGKLPPLVRDDE